MLIYLSTVISGRIKDKWMVSSTVVLDRCIASIKKDIDGDGTDDELESRDRHLIQYGMVLKCVHLGTGAILTIHSLSFLLS